MCLNRSGTLTDIFKLITRFGEFIGLIGIGLYLAVKNRKALLAAALSFISFDIILLTLKRSLDYPRPLAYFQHGEITPILEYKKLLHYSMPSGHTYTAFFCASFLISFFSLNRKWQVLLFSAAILVGVSRMYLMCHFKEDVFVGSVLGIFAGVLPLFIYQKYFNKE